MTVKVNAASLCLSKDQTHSNILLNYFIFVEKFIFLYLRQIQYLLNCRLELGFNLILSFLIFIFYMDPMIYIVFWETFSVPCLSLKLIMTDIVNLKILK